MLKKVLKKIVLYLLAFVIVVLFSINDWNTDGAERIPEGLYPTCGVITEIDGDLVTFTDPTGNDWCFEGAEDWMVGDIVAAIMDDMNTASIYDDEIVNVRYAGFIS